MRRGALVVVISAPMPPADDRLELVVLAEERLSLPFRVITGSPNIELLCSTT
jgi:hypothetical protein